MHMTQGMERSILFMFHMIFTVFAIYACMNGKLDFDWWSLVRLVKCSNLRLRGSGWAHLHV